MRLWHVFFYFSQLLPRLFSGKGDLKLFIFYFLEHFFKRKNFFGYHVDIISHFYMKRRMICRYRSLYLPGWNATRFFKIQPHVFFHSFLSRLMGVAFIPQARGEGEIRNVREHAMKGREDF